MPLVALAVIQSVVEAGRVHTRTTALALATAGVDLNRHALTDREFIDAGSLRDHGPHIFVAGREALVEGQSPLNQGRGTVVNDLKIGRTNGDRVDPHQDFTVAWYGCPLAFQDKGVGIAKDPRLHRFRN